MKRAALLAVAVLVALPAAAPATIVPQPGRLDVRLGDTVGEVRDELGRPDRARVVDNEILGRQRVYRYGRTRILFNGAGVDATVIAMNTTSRRERMANGIGVGSTRRAVRQRVRGVRCRREGGIAHCFVGRWRPGRVVTDFLLDRGGMVERVTIGRVID